MAVRGVLVATSIGVIELSTLFKPEPELVTYAVTGAGAALAAAAEGVTASVTNPVTSVAPTVTTDSTR